MKRRFATLDVFTDQPLAGNPLAVVQDCAGLDTARMQAIAREFNLSETVFLLPPRDPINTARLRIFTPTQELPFAGHPTVGAAILIGLRDAPGMIAAQDILIVLEAEIGVISCTVGRSRGQAARARFTLPRLPEPAGVAGSSLALAEALGLAEDDIGFDGHAPCVFSAGNPFCFVPVATRAALAQAAPNLAAWPAGFSHMERGAAFLYTRECERAGSHFHARMFAPGLGVSEDPATGSAVAAFAGVLMQSEKIADGAPLFVIEQGFEMGRPSIITLGLDIVDGRLMEANIGGQAVLVQDGTIDL
ncbi:MAG: phenazine biosynthesis protein PhzF [Hyphomicrobiales bacterium]|nr:phenazine biosynthesis protein PhzF [Hyphomicrobiales bacterium]